LKSLKKASNAQNKPDDIVISGLPIAPGSGSNSGDDCDMSETEKSKMKDCRRVWVGLMMGQGRRTKNQVCHAADGADVWGAAGARTRCRCRYRYKVQVQGAGAGAGAGGSNQSLFAVREMWQKFIIIG